MAKTQGITHLDEAAFRQAIKSGKKPVFVDFYADWCGPCIAAAPIIEKLAGEYQDKMLIAKLNVDENPGLAQQFGVMSIPTVLIFQPGDENKIIGKQVGFPGEAGYRQLIDQALES